MEKEFLLYTKNNINKQCEYLVSKRSQKKNTGFLNKFDFKNYINLKNQKTACTQNEHYMPKKDVPS